MIEIDGVRRQLESPITEAGDYISDEYFRLIDLSTSPDRMSRRNRDSIASSVRRLNRNLFTASTILVGSEVENYYDEVIGQLNEMNADIEGVGQLEPLITDDTRFQGYSGSFEWAA